MPNTELIEARLRFLGIDHDAAQELRNAGKILEPELDRMLEEFYTQILDEPEVRAVFADDNAIERAREAQKNHWLEALFGGSFKSSYFDKTEKIGRAHARVGLTPNWYIGGYGKMLAQFIRQIAVEAPRKGRDASSMIEALCKAVLLDLDLVIHCYLEAKDESMLAILSRTTRFSADIDNLNAELGVLAEQVMQSTEDLLNDVSDEHRQSNNLKNLRSNVDALMGKVRQLDERLNQLQTGDRLYVHESDDKESTFAKLKALIRGS